MPFAMQHGAIDSGYFVIKKHPAARIAGRDAKFQFRSLIPAGADHKQVAVNVINDVGSRPPFHVIFDAAGMKRPLQAKATYTHNSTQFVVFLIQFGI